MGCLDVCLAVEVWKKKEERFYIKKDDCLWVKNIIFRRFVSSENWGIVRKKVTIPELTEKKKCCLCFFD